MEFGAFGEFLKMCEEKVASKVLLFKIPGFGLVYPLLNFFCISDTHMFVFAIRIWTSLAPIAFFGVSMDLHLCSCRILSKGQMPFVKALHESHPFIGSLAKEFPTIEAWSASSPAPEVQIHLRMRKEHMLSLKISMAIVFMCFSLLSCQMVRLHMFLVCEGSVHDKTHWNQSGLVSLLKETYPLRFEEHFCHWMRQGLPWFHLFLAQSNVGPGVTPVDNSIMWMFKRIGCVFCHWRNSEGQMNENHVLNHLHCLGKPKDKANLFMQPTGGLLTGKKMTSFLFRQH